MCNGLGVSLGLGVGWRSSRVIDYFDCLDLPSERNRGGGSFEVHVYVLLAWLHPNRDDIGQSVPFL